MAVNRLLKIQAMMFPESWTVTSVNRSAPIALSTAKPNMLWKTHRPGFVTESVERAGRTVHPQLAGHWDV